ncbi:MAG: chemotaxis protein CheW [Gammaproteobacteria bacterium]|nr:chemotaxis protein CheW [Gammaproteobacteria bacterium]|tara:strand:+ start:8430 stop:9179 length:750 start_codon:yes stop_codon:yes gene_type:complete
MASGYTSTQTTRTTAAPGIVQDYLDALLRTVLPEDIPAPELEQASAVQEDWPPALLAETPATQVAASSPITVDAVTRAGELTPQLPGRAARPWADKPFASLLFDVMGLKLAAPLHELGGIMPLADKVQPMAAQADWFMGLIRWNGRTLRVVDTARFVMPERVTSEQALEYQSVVVLGDSHWALAVNNADQSVHLQPSDIRWRETLGKRPWLAGTVLERLCALLDVDVLVAMLDASDTAKQVKADLAKNR